MDKYIYDENNGIWYELHDNYYIPFWNHPPKKNEDKQMAENLGLYPLAD